MEKLKHFAHGECNLFETTEIPKGAKKLTNYQTAQGLYVLADSETQGNYHVIENKDYKQFIEFYEVDGKTFIKAEKPFEVRCLNLGRHERMTIPAGIWEKTIAQEFDPFTEIKRHVAD